MANKKRFMKAVKKAKHYVTRPITRKGRLSGNGPTSTKFMRGTHKTSEATSARNAALY